jgi:hypothetical protein
MNGKQLTFGGKTTVFGRKQFAKDNSNRLLGLISRKSGESDKYCKKIYGYKLTLSSSIHRDRDHKFYENSGFKKHGYSFLIEL